MPGRLLPLCALVRCTCTQYHRDRDANLRRQSEGKTFRRKIPMLTRNFPVLFFFRSARDALFSIRSRYASINNSLLIVTHLPTEFVMSNATKETTI